MLTLTDENIGITDVTQPLRLKKLKLTVLWRPTKDLLELTPKKDVLFIIGVWNAKVGNREIPGVTGKFGLGVQNEARQWLTESCQENALVIADTHPLPTAQETTHTWTSPNGQYRNQIDYIVCSQRWRSSIQSSKTRPGAEWLRSWTPYCKTLTYIEESRENH